jgi:uncharacterized protein (TIGR02284 family)
MAAEDREEPDLNRDPLTNEPGAHPVGTGVGAAGGAVAGAAAGTIGGPVGTLVGGVIGAVVGGLAGKAAAEAVNPSTEEAHWRENYSREPYFEQGRSFDDYRPAYMHGMQGRLQHDTDWDAAEPRLASEWSNARASSGLSWEQARPASRAAWDRVEAMRGGTGAMGSDTAMVRANDLAGSSAAGAPMTGGTDMAGSSIGMDQDVGGRSSAAGIGSTGMESGMGVGRSSTEGRSAMGTDMGRSTGAAGTVGAMQSAGNTGGDRDDVVDALQNLVECCKDGEYGFRTSAEQAKRQDLKSLLLQRAEDCRRGADELNAKIRSLGGKVEDSGSALGAMHRGWVSMKSTLSTYDDKAVLEECERGEDNALARYRKAMKQQLPPEVQQMVERQMQGVQRNHDQIKMLRDQFRAAGNTGTGDTGSAGSMARGNAAGAGMDMTQGSNTASGSSQPMGSMSQSSGVNTGTAGVVGGMQSAGNTSGDRGDVVDALQDLVECCKDGEYGFRTSAEQASSAELKSLFTRRADDCRRGAEELNQQIRGLGGKAEDSGSALGAVHRGWVSVRTTLSTYDDKAVLEECERGEDNAVARYRKALKQQLPEQVRQIVERQAQAVQRNHDEVKRLRDQYRQ